MRKHLSFATLSIIGFSLLARHVGAGESTTGIGAIGGGLSVTPAGTVSLSVPLNLPPARGGVPIPLRIVHDGSTAGAGRGGDLGVGWSIPFTYVEKTETFAHTRPKYFSDPNRAPEPLDRVYLSLDGAKMLMVPVDNSGTYRAMVGPQTMTLVDRGSLGWRLFDGSGHTFDMTRDPRLLQQGMWLLTEVNDATTRNPVRLSYGVQNVAVGDGTAQELELSAIEYNLATGGACAKNRIELAYGPWNGDPGGAVDPNLPGNGNGDPFALWSVGGALRVRTRVLRRVNVLAHGDTCGTSDQRVRLRRYQFSYNPDADTGSPRLVASDVYGRQGTAEESQRLPIGRYQYGSATTDGKLVMEKQVLPGAPQDRVQDVRADKLGGHRTRYITREVLTDITGDGRADFLVPGPNDISRVFVAQNASTGANAGPAVSFSQTYQELLDIPVGKVISEHEQKKIGDWEGNEDTFIRLIDMNGDGRTDVLESKERDYWTLYLNLPGRVSDPSASPDSIVWSERRIETGSLKDALAARGLLDSTDKPLPLSRSISGMSISYRNVCADTAYPADSIDPVGGSPGYVFSDDNPCLRWASIPTRAQTRSVKVWDLLDMNGDSYPDFVSTELPVARLVYPTACKKHKPTGTMVSCEERFEIGFTEDPKTPVPTAKKSDLVVQWNEGGAQIPADASPFSRPGLMGLADTCGIESWTGDDSIPHAVLWKREADDLDDPEHRFELDEQQSIGELATDDSSTPDNQPIYETEEHQQCGFLDVNGDGILDRVEHLPDQALLGTGSSFSSAIPIPGLASVSTRIGDCSDSPAHPYYLQKATNSDGVYADVTGDGLPDYVNGNQVYVGTTVGFRDPIPLVGQTFGAASYLRCDEVWDRPFRTFADVNGDGRVDVALRADDGNLEIWRVANSSGPGAYDAGRLVSVENGYGATSTVQWLSAKNDVFAVHNEPAPEIVVGRSSTMTSDSAFASVQYAYGDGGYRFDAAADRYGPTGFVRRATLALVPNSTGEHAGDGVARVVNSFAPSNTSGGYDDYVLTGLPRALAVLDGHFDDDAWHLLRYEDGYAANNVHGGTVTDYATQSRSLETNDCVGFHDYYQTAPSLLVAINGRYDRPCTTTGFAYSRYTESWHGASAFDGKNVTTAQRIDQVDDLGRALRIQHLGDFADPDDNVCEELEYAGSGPFLIHDAVRSRTFGECHDAGGKVFSRIEIAYDEPQAAAGSVIAGLPTTITSHVYETTGGNEQTHLVTKREYDSWGNMTRQTQTGDADTRTTSFQDWGTFLLAPRRSVVTVSDVAASFVSSSQLDSFSLSPLQVTGPNGTTLTSDYDGFDREVAQGVIRPGELQETLLSQTTYGGFEVGAGSARQIRTDSYQTSSGDLVTTTTDLDELGRATRSEQWLGDDYTDSIVTRDVRFDAFGRPKFVADPYPAANPGDALYGTTYHYRTDGSVECAIRAPGEAALVHQTNEAAEVFPTCFEHTYVDSQELRRVQGPNELVAAGPQTGGWSEEIVGATGLVHEKSRWYAGQRKELARFSYDPQGSLTRLDRYAEPGTAGKPVTWSFVRDSAGRALVVSEPSAAPRFNNYDAWGNLASTSWEDPNGSYEVRYKHDALGRLLQQEEAINNVVQPKTVVEYAYDDEVLPGYENVTGRLAATYLYTHEKQATGRGDRTPLMRVVYGYDDLGRVNAISRLGEEGEEYRERYDYRLDGQLARASFELPDTGYATESAAYRYDSAGRLDGVSWEEGGNTQQLFQANDIDPFGRYLHVTYGNGVEERSYYKSTNRRELTSTYMATPTGESRSTSYTRYSPDLRVLERMETSNGANGTTVEQSTYQYDSLYELKRASTENAFGSMMRDEVFTYDGLGNTRSVDDLLGSVDSSITMRGDDLDRVCRTEPEPSGTGGSVGTGGTVGGISTGGVLLPSDGQTRLWLEAESGQLSSPMRFATDSDASLGAYAEVPAGSGNNAGSASFNVSVPASGTYYLWLRVRAASTADDSYTIKLGGKGLTWNAGAASSWTWKRVNEVSLFLRQPAAFSVSKGTAKLTIAAREDGVQIDRLLITTDAYTNPSTIEPTSTPTNVVVEAESGLRHTPWSVEIAGNTSAGAYLVVPKGQENQGSPDTAPKTTVSVSVPKDGYYAIWARVLAPDAYTNSFFVRVDGKENPWWTWHVPTSTAWQTRRVYNHDGSSNQPVSIWLKAGEHTITLAQRESGTAIDTIIVSNQFGTSTPATAPAPAPDDCQYRYDAQGNVVTIASSQNPTRNFQYDLHGRVTSLVSGTAIGKYRYGPEGEVMTYVQGGTGANNRSEYHYGPFTKSYFTKDGQSLSLIERRIPGVPIIRRGTGSDATVLYGHAEGPGLRRVTDETGAITQELEYRAYGGIVEDSGLAGGVGSLWEKFNGGDHLEAFGVVHMGARLYDPRTGRFLQRDPLIIPRTTTMMNPYAFAWNDPINYGDPSGMDPCRATACIYANSGGDVWLTNEASLGFLALDLTWQFIQHWHDGNGRDELPSWAPRDAQGNYLLGGGPPIEISGTAPPSVEDDWAWIDQTQRETLDRWRRSDKQWWKDAERRDRARRAKIFLSYTNPVLDFIYSYMEFEATVLGSGMFAPAADLLVVDGVGSAGAEAATAEVTGAGLSRGGDVQAPPEIEPPVEPPAAEGAGRGGTKLKPDSAAQGPHSTFKRDPQTGKVTGHAEWDAAGNPVKRTDVTGSAHGPVKTPHTHEYGPPNVNPATGKSYPGNEVRVRPATPDEIPR